MDPLSDVLASLTPQGYVARGCGLEGDVAIRWPWHTGVKCYAMLRGSCWLTVDTVADPVHVAAGDCFLLPRGLPFCLLTDLSIPPVDFQAFVAQRAAAGLDWDDGPGARYFAGGHFTLAGEHAGMLLDSLPPIVHIRSEADRAAMRWSLERMQAELLDPQPGSSLIAMQLAYSMLIQALRLHLMEAAEGKTGWLFALADRQMRDALGHIHDNPGHSWTLAALAQQVGMSRSVFAQRFRQTVGTTPLEYLTRWRMLLAAERLRTSAEAVSAIAGALGYRSESAFGKAFRKVMRASPRQYASQARSAQPAVETLPAWPAPLASVPSSLARGC